MQYLTRHKAVPAALRLVRLIYGLSTATRYNQAILDIPVLVHETPFALPLISCSVELVLPRLIKGLKPTNRTGQHASQSLDRGVTLTRRTSSHCSNSDTQTHP